MLNAYYLKEAFYKVLDAPDSTTAKQLMTKWILDAQNSHIPEYLSCSNTLVNWQKGILNSFDVPYSNSFTEGCNNKIKVFKRNAYGYRNFERFRKRILHMFSCHTSTAFSSTCYQIYILQFLAKLLTKSQKIILCSRLNFKNFIFKYRGVFFP